ncbi:MAG: hydrogenase formation protein HypD [Anaerolineae bacterium]|nr:hydrogenase formation protein HypD [Anaerolineae bacterium]
MKFIDEFRDPRLARSLVEHIRQRAHKPMRLMEFCGGHTHAILRFGIRQALPPTVEMLSGPGCPVCVTAAADLDRAIAMAGVPGVILATFGDMIRVPGSRESLQQAKARGADVRIVYSPLDAVRLAEQEPARPVVFLGVGFETTAPGVAASILDAHARGIENYYVLCLHKLTPPATRAILDSGEVNLSGILGPGHVTTIIGTKAWEFLPHEYGVPIAVAGFEPLDILRGISLLVERIAGGEARVDNAYSRSVLPEGNRAAQDMMNRVFEVADAEWRGLGTIPASGLRIRLEFQVHDAALAFPVDVPPSREPPGCRCGDVLRGVLAPPSCPLFGKACTPEHPVGPCMVSAEGACAAYYQFGDAGHEG